MLCTGNFPSIGSLSHPEMQFLHLSKTVSYAITNVTTGDIAFMRVQQH